MEERIDLAENLLKKLMDRASIGSLILEEVFDYFDHDHKYQGTLYAKFGGMSGINRIMKNIYKEILKNPEILNYFEGKDVDRVIKKQTNYLVYITGGPAVVDRTKIKEVHMPLKIREEDFYIFIGIFTDELMKEKLSLEEVESIMQKIVLLKSKIVSKEN